MRLASLIRPGTFVITKSYNDFEVIQVIGTKTDYKYDSSSISYMRSYISGSWNTSTNERTSSFSSVKAVYENERAAVSACDCCNMMSKFEERVVRIIRGKIDTVLDDGPLPKTDVELLVHALTCHVAGDALPMPEQNFYERIEPHVDEFLVLTKLSRA